MKKILVTALSFLMLSSFVACNTNIASSSESSADLSYSEKEQSSSEKTDAEIWIESEKAFDYNDDGKIDASDYEINQKYIEWKTSDENQDFDSDQKVTYQDYLLYGEFNEWIESDEALDYTGDRKINIDDFNLVKKYEKWRKTSEAEDLNGDKKINYEDYLVYEDCLDWLSSKEAYDYTEDEKTDKEDYLYYISEAYTNYLNWCKGNDAIDINKDNNIDYEDYKQWLVYLDWLDSNDSLDYNGDRKINYEDYHLYLNPSENAYSTWRTSECAKDYNGDDIIDYVDYEYYQFYGTYNFKSFIVSGHDFTVEIAGEMVLITELLEETENIVINFSEKKTEVEYTGNLDFKEIVNAFESMKVSIASSILLECELELPFASLDTSIKLKMFLSKQVDGTLICSQKVEINGRSMNLQFELEKAK